LKDIRHLTLDRAIGENYLQIFKNLYSLGMGGDKRRW